MIRVCLTALFLAIAVCSANNHRPNRAVRLVNIQPEDQVETHGPKEAMVLVTIVYDNFADDAELKAAWGYSALVERNGTTVLFDTGGEGTTLLENMKRLGVGDRIIDAVVLSHPHWDHVGGLEALLENGAEPLIYVPKSFPTRLKERIAHRATVIEVAGSRQIAPGVHTTGEVISNMTEQALVVESDEGIVVITGCAHQGIVDMVKRAKRVVDGTVKLVMGGFHLKDTSRVEIDAIMLQLQRLGVQSVAPSHCTGEQACEGFRAVFGKEFLNVGVGWSVKI